MAQGELPNNPLDPLTWVDSNPTDHPDRWECRFFNEFDDNECLFIIIPRNQFDNWLVYNREEKRYYYQIDKGWLRSLREGEKVKKNGEV